MPGPTDQAAPESHGGVTTADHPPIIGKDNDMSYAYYLQDNAEHSADAATVTAAVTVPRVDTAYPRLVLSWSDVPNPSGSDWVGLHALGAHDTSYLTYVYINRASGNGSLTIPANTPPGAYELRMFANDGFERLTAGDRLDGGAVVVIAQASVSAVGSLKPGGDLRPVWDDIPNPTPSDWIGLHAFGAPDGEYLNYIYTNGKESGIGNLRVPANTPPGDYELRLFSNDSFTRLAMRGLLVEGPARLYPEFSSINPHVSPGGHLGFSWSGITNPTGSDWVGLYSFGDPDKEYLTYVYINGASGTGSLPIPSNAKPGRHEVRMFANDGYVRLATGFRSVSVMTAARLGYHPSVPFPASSKGRVIAYWRGIPVPTPSDWVGIYRDGAPDTAYLTFAYTNGRPGGARELAIPAGTAPGEYQVRLFSNDSYTRLAVDNPFTLL